MSRSARTISRVPQNFTTPCSARSAASGPGIEALHRLVGGADSPGLGVIKPFDGNAATLGNGAMVALEVDSQAKVKALYDKAHEARREGRRPSGVFGLALSTLRTFAISTATSSTCFISRLI